MCLFSPETSTKNNGLTKTHSSSACSQTFCVNVVLVFTYGNRCDELYTYVLFCFFLTVDFALMLNFNAHASELRTIAIGLSAMSVARTRRWLSERMDGSSIYVRSSDILNISRIN